MGKKKSEFIRVTRNKKADKALIKGMSMLDITKNIPLTPEGNVEGLSDLTEGQREQYPLVKKHIRMHLNRSLKNAGVSRWASNFGSMHPMNILLNADAHYLSKSVVRILDDEEMLAAAIGDFEKMFGTSEVSAYCKKIENDLDGLGEDEEEEFSRQITTPILQAIMPEMLIAQQTDRIFQISHTELTPEDFDKKETFDRKNLHKKWYAPDAKKVKTFVPLDLEFLAEENCEELRGTFEDMRINLITYEEFKKRIDAKDAEILLMKERGVRQADIAKKLGCTQGAISKRLRAIQNQWKEFNED